LSHSAVGVGVSQVVPVGVQVQVPVQVQPRKARLFISLLIKSKSPPLHYSEQAY